MKFNSSLQLISISLLTLACLPTQKPAMALINQETSPANSALMSRKQFTTKQPIQIAIDDKYWGPQRDFEITMPGEELENNDGKLMTMNVRTQTVYMIFYRDIPLDIYSLNSEDIREVLQTALRETIDTKGKVIKSTNMVIQGYPGIELLIQHSDGTQGQYQGYVVRRRLYLLGARSSDELTTEAANFFDSFRVYPTRIVSY